MGKITSIFSFSFIFKEGIEEECGYLEWNHNYIVNYRAIFQTFFCVGMNTGCLKMHQERKATCLPRQVG